MQAKPTFAKPELNESFEIIQDQHYIIPGKHNGKVSQIKDAGLIEGMISRGSNLVARKTKVVPMPSGKKD